MISITAAASTKARELGHMHIHDPMMEDLPSRASLLTRQAVIALFLLGLIGALALMAWPETSIQTTRVVLPEPHPGPLPLPGDLLALSPDAAIRANAERPADVTDHFAARPFLVGTSSPALPSAVECLTTAIYYEAATEPLDGQRAVAQVVLNRLRNPSFPHSVCGVVFQGSERTTGCQFSFACDGAMARRPIPAIWVRARQVAAAALGGYVFAGVGLATHYHANYVLPRWASTLDKVSTIGVHIFYRWRGPWGQPSAFVERYSGSEALTLLTSAVTRATTVPPNATASTDTALLHDSIGTQYMVPSAIYGPKSEATGLAKPGDGAAELTHDDQREPPKDIAPNRWAIRRLESGANSGPN